MTIFKIHVLRGFVWGLLCLVPGPVFAIGSNILTDCIGMPSGTSPRKVNKELQEIESDPGKAAAATVVMVPLIPVFQLLQFSYSMGCISTSSFHEGLAQLEQNREARRRFLKASKEELKEQIAQGRGAVLDEFARISGCPKESTRFAEVSREQFTSLFKGDPPAEKLLWRFEQLNKSKELRHICSYWALVLVEDRP